MELKDRISIINEENMNGLTALYGNMTINDLERIVNKHFAVAIDEIKEDINDKENETNTYTPFFPTDCGNGYTRFEYFKENV